MIGSINNATDIYSAQAATNNRRVPELPEQAQGRFNQEEDSVQISSAAAELESARFAPPRDPDGDSGPALA
jgi:hypothetical protein